MELIIINSEKLKVILSPSDMQELDVTCEDLDYETPHTKRAFWEILDKAKSKVGFDSQGYRLYVQVYPSKDGGCEMFVTKLLYENNNLSKKEAEADRCESIAVMCPDEESLISLCKRMHPHCIYKSSLHLLESGEYILLLDKGKKPSYVQKKNTCKEPTYLGEYGTVRRLDELCVATLCEHSRVLVSEKAVELFAKTF